MFIDPKSIIDKAVRAVSGSDSDDSDNSEDTQVTRSAEGFDGFLRAVLGKTDQQEVSEEELFAALMQERVASNLGEEAALTYRELFEQYTTSLQKGGYVSYEDAAKGALQELRAQGLVSAEQADSIYSEAFSAAQLDSNLEALYDDRGGANDPTVAVQALEQALLASRVRIEQFESGEDTVTLRSLDEASNTKSTSFQHAASGAATASSPVTPDNGTSSNGEDPDVALALQSPHGNEMDGPNGFLFKPISENQGTLAVLMPEVLAYRVSGVLLRDTEGRVVDEGYSTGYGELGTREKFSFSKRGGDYPRDLTVEVHLMDGTVTRYRIPDPSQRYD